MSQLFTDIAQNGFAVAVAAYLLLRMEKRLEALTEAIRELRQSVAAPLAQARQVMASPGSYGAPPGTAPGVAGRPRATDTGNPRGQRPVSRDTGVR